MTKTYETKVFDIGYGNKAFVTIIRENKKDAEEANLLQEAERFVDFLTDESDSEFDQGLINNLNCMVEYSPVTIDVNGVTYVRKEE